MKGTSAAVFTLLATLILPASLSAKGNVLKITIKGAGLATPIEITDLKIGEFTVWAGPGVSVNGVEQTEGFIIDWSKGVVAQLPTGLEHHEVFFYSNFRKKEGSIVYAVSYDYNPSTEQGFIYLPGRDDELFQFNKGTMWHGHGLEGNWFRATSAWENFVRPLVARARATGPSR